MMKLFATLFLTALVAALAQHTSNHVCPNRCNADRSLSVRECNHPVTRTLCEVRACNGGFSCSLPANSFLIASNQLPALEMAVEYSWGADQRDLDTSTRFLNANVGYSCNNPTPYVQFGGDNTANGGSEVATIDFEKARSDGKWEDATSVTAHAGWYNSDNQGSAQLRVTLRRKDSGAVAEGASLSTRVQPGTQGICASTRVAEVLIVRGAQHTRVTLVSA